MTAYSGKIISWIETPVQWHYIELWILQRKKICPPSKTDNLNEWMKHGKDVLIWQKWTWKHLSTKFTKNHTLYKNSIENVNTMNIHPSTITLNQSKRNCKLFQSAITHKNVKKYSLPKYWDQKSIKTVLWSISIHIRTNYDWNIKMVKEQKNIEIIYIYVMYEK